MAQSNPKIEKSKSSDSVLKLSANNCKSQSNAAFYIPIYNNRRLKRGLYVKRKPTEVSSNDESNSSPQKESVKAPKRPCPGTKPFLSSALKLLSKSTASTQYPDSKTHPMMYVAKDELENDVTISKDRTGDKQKKKKRYKSKILKNYNYGEDRIQVLKFKKALVNTPSLDNSAQEDEEDFDKIKWSEFLPRLVKPDEEELKLEKEKNLSHLVREVTEGRMNIEKRDADKEEPATLVSEQKDNGFYNFFVDLLETTFSVYNMKANYKSTRDLKSVVSSKVAFEIDKVVADKLKIGPNCHKEPAKYCCVDSKPPDWNDVRLHELKESKKGKKRKESIEFLPTKRKRNKSELGYNERSNFIRSAPAMQKKSVTKKKEATKTLRQNLLNSIKEQLTKECSNYLFEEPTSLYQALKVMAKNKRKTQKSIKFDKSSFKNNSETKRRNSSKNKPKYEEIETELARKFSPQKYCYQNENRTSDVSNHSLIVYNYDEQKKRVRRPSNPLPKPTNSYNNRKESYNMMQQVLMAVEALNRNKSRLTT